MIPRILRACLKNFLDLKGDSKTSLGYLYLFVYAIQKLLRAKSNFLNLPGSFKRVQKTFYAC